MRVFEWQAFRMADQPTLCHQSTRLLASTYLSAASRPLLTPHKTSYFIVTHTQLHANLFIRVRQLLQLQFQRVSRSCFPRWLQRSRLSSRQRLYLRLVWLRLPSSPDSCAAHSHAQARYASRWPT
jgi:hypothetical protein